MPGRATNWTRSPLLRRTLYRRHFLVRSVPGAATRTDASHGPIVDAIRARDSEAALAAMDAHFRIWDEESSKVLSAPSEATSGKRRLPGAA
jgi:DNA-binding GntR family transcriptional regulator